METMNRVDLDAMAGLFRPHRSDQGLLVTIVGFDGSGKTTQIERIGEALRARGREVIETRQPTDWYRELGDVKVFHDHGGPVETAHILSLLAAADRRRHVADLIDPALARGAAVLCDRYVYATFGVFVHRGVDFDLLARINHGIPRPDVAVYLDVPTEVLVARLHRRDGDALKHEEKTADRIRSITSTYDELVAAGHLTRVDGARSADEVTAEILASIDEHPA
jgi:dTMP kinase